MTENNVKMVEIHIGDRVALRKAHPCGANEWVVYRVGADIGLRCVGCERTVLLSRGVFTKRLKRMIKPAADSPVDGAHTRVEQTRKHEEE